ncbi:hypothetical protein OHAE_1370 [Ochrobactrum soli]|uniref:Uncharacterized protein n=1 Tax=Ochrobactrum soli TaxID=2448455 RepID=A0A2P9HNA6_9HYPH|nr:hypothetical protein OHAE_1370 [[Ochrobactrum] soli]
MQDAACEAAERFSAPERLLQTEKENLASLTRAHCSILK